MAPADTLSRTFAAVSKHLRVLEGARLVSRGRDAQYRPAMLDDLTEAGPDDPRPDDKKET